MRSRTLILTGAILAIVVLALASAYLTVLGQANGRLRAALAALEADGRPMSAAEVIPPSVPDEENAAPLYESAFLRLEGSSGPMQTLQELVRKLDAGDIAPEERIEFRYLLARGDVATALEEVRRAAAMPNSRFNVSWDDGMELALRMNSMLRLSRLLAACVRLRMEEGDHGAAWETAETALRVADALRQEPTLTSQLVRVAQISIALRAVRRLAAEAPPDAATRARLMAVLKAMDDRAPFIAASDGDRLMFVDSLFLRVANRELGDLHISSPTAKRHLRFALYLPPVHRLDRAFYLEEMHKFTRAMSEPYHRSPGLTLNDPPWYAILSATVLPQMASVRQRVEFPVAEIRVARVALALEAFRDARGTLPASLEELTPDFLLALPEDPYSGAPLVYARDGERFKLYSVGPDGVDDDGRPDKENHPHSRYRGDIGWAPPPNLPPPAE